MGGFKEEPQAKTVKNGVLRFCFYSGSNKYQPGDYTVARVTYAYSGGETPVQPGSFVDVPEGSFCYDAVEWAVEHGITNGVTDQYFDPNGICTRAQAVTFLYRAQSSPPALGANPFTDVSYGSFCYHAVLWAVNHGVTKGTTATIFSPSAPCTCGQVVTFLYRCLAE